MSSITDSPLMLDGELTIRTAAQVHEQLQQALAEGHHALDLSRIEAIDSAGVQLLLAARRSLVNGGMGLHIQGASQPVQELLTLYGLRDAFAPAAPTSATA